MRRYSATLALKPVITEDGDFDVAAAIQAVKDVTVTDAGENTAVDAAADDVTTAFGASSGLKVFIAGTPTKAQVLAALDSVAQQVKSNDAYS